MTFRIKNKVKRGLQPGLESRFPWFPMFRHMHVLLSWPFSGKRCGNAACLVKMLKTWSGKSEKLEAGNLTWVMELVGTMGALCRIPCKPHFGLGSCGRAYRGTLAAPEANIFFASETSYSLLHLAKMQLVKHAGIFLSLQTCIADDRDVSKCWMKAHCSFENW